MEAGRSQVPDKPPLLQQDVRTVVEELQLKGELHNVVEAAVTDPLDGAGGGLQDDNEIAAHGHLSGNTNKK